MPLWQKGARIAARRLPKVIDPTTHALLDYVIAGSFLVRGALIWRRQRRAAVASLICGGSALANAMLTDYPGGITPRMSYRTHGRNDSAIAGFTASAPSLLSFSRHRNTRLFFNVAALLETAIIGLTDFEQESERESLVA